MSAEDDMLSLLQVPTIEKAVAFHAKYDHDAWKGATIRTIMCSVYKARIKLKIDVVQSYAWLRDNGFNMEIPERISESDANDIDLKS